MDRFEWLNTKAKLLHDNTYQYDYHVISMYLNVKISSNNRCAQTSVGFLPSIMYYAQNVSVSIFVSGNCYCKFNITLREVPACDHQKSLVWLSFTKIFFSNYYPLVCGFLTNAADVFLEWNPEGHCRGKKKRGKRQRDWENERRKSVSASLMTYIVKADKKMYIHL